MGQIIGEYKSRVYHGCLTLCKEQNQTLGKLWQRGYCEHIIHNQEDYLSCVEYILQNPGKRAGN